MGRFGIEELTAMTVLLKQGHSQSAVARILGVSEGTVRYHLSWRSTRRVRSLRGVRYEGLYAPGKADGLIGG